MSETHPESRPSIGPPEGRRVGGRVNGLPSDPSLVPRTGGEGAPEAVPSSRSLFEAMRDAIILLGADGRILDVNRAYTEMTGFTREEVVGAGTPFPHWPEEQHGPLHAKYQGTMAGISGEFDIVYRRKNGERFPVILSVTTVRDAKGGAVAHVLLAKDATARARVQAELKRQSIAMNSAMDGMAIHDREGRFVYLNEAHARAYGFERPEALLGKTWRVLYDDAELSRFDSEIMPAFRASGRWRGEAVGRRSDGTPFPQDLSLTALEDGGLVCVVRDTSERKAEHETLRGLEERLRTVVANTPIVLWALDRDGVFTLSEGKGLAALGLKPGEVVGRSVFDVYADFPKIAASARRALAGETFTETIHVGDLVFESRYAPLRDEAGRVTGVIGVGTDVTDAKRASEAMLHAQKLESLGVLAGGIAHDFNNLLVGILGNAGLALLDLPPNSSARKIVEQIELGGQRAAELTRQLLAYSGRGRFVVERLDLTAIARETVRLQQVAVVKDAALEYDLADDLPPVDGDPTQIRQVVMNLVANASDALGSKGGVIRVSTGTTVVGAGDPAAVDRVPPVGPGEYVYLEVTDTGCGMDAATKAKMFDPFFTTKFAGRGLGLAVVLGIARSHGGAIEVVTAPGKGSSFRLLLPPAPGPRPERRTPKAGEDDWRGEGSILVVDDEGDVRTVIAGMLRHLGFASVLASDGREGVDTFRRRADDFTGVILDMTMPHMNGADALREMRGIRPAVPVLIISGYDERDTASQFREVGPDAFLQKPFTVSGLAAALRRLLSRHAAP